MTSFQPERRYQSRINPACFDRVALKSSLTSLSNAICIENLIKKKSMFAPNRLDCIKPEKPGKFSFDRSSIKYKKEIEPHKTKSANSIMERSKAHYGVSKNVKLAHMPNQKNQTSKRLIRRPISRQLNHHLGNMLPSTASFYVKKGEKPIHLQLKMEIKKMESSLKISDEKPDQKSQDHQQSRSKCQRKRNFPRVTQSELQKIDSSLTDYVKEESFIDQEIKSLKNVPENFISSQNYKEESKTQIASRNVKSTLASYFKIKPKKKQSSGQPPWMTHIKDLLLDSKQCDELTIDLIEPQHILEESLENKAQLDNLLTDKTAQCLEVSLYNNKTKLVQSVFSRQRSKRVEIASITKIMTCLLTLNIVRVFKINMHTEKHRVSERASKMPGTSAELCYSDTLTIYELLHGLMLPSGNDAAVALGEWGGKVIRKYCRLAQNQLRIKNSELKAGSVPSDPLIERRSPLKLFIRHMNKAASILKLKNTHFANTHGLMNNRAYSTARDVAKLTCIAMNDSDFRQIVGKKEFQSKIYNRTYCQHKKSTWNNTNKLLKIEGFVGVKTGVTPAAGPCLSSMFQISPEDSIVIVVLKVKSMEQRFKQSLSLLQLTLKKLNIEKCEDVVYSLQTQLKNQNSRPCSQEANMIDQLQNQAISQGETSESDEEFSEAA